MKLRSSRLCARLAPMAAALVVGVSTATAALVGSGTAHAGLDSRTVLDTPNGYSLEAQLWDTSLQFYPPLDRNPLSQEWFEDATVAYIVRGDKAADFSGSVTFGYQVGYPFSTSGSITLNSPERDRLTRPEEPTDPTIRQQLRPTPGYSLSLGFGPGVQTVEVAAGDVEGTGGSFIVHGVHATVTGVIGRLSIRPYVTLTSNKGDSVTTYGPIWNH